MRIFIAWDTTAQALRTCLDGLRWGTSGIDFVVPGLEVRGGEILREVLLEGIAGADRVLVFVDRPNANVAFELGLALGLGKPVALVHHGLHKPTWLASPPLANLLVHRVQGASDVEAAVQIEELWTRSPREGDPLEAQEPDRTLFLCPTRSEGESCRRVQRKVEPGWKQLPPSPFSLQDLSSLTAGVERVVWTITQYGQDADERDGAENAAAGILAGWFVGTRLGQSLAHDSSPSRALAETRARLRVLRSRTAREVVDVQLLEQTFATLDEYARLLRAEAPAAAMPARAAAGPITNPAPPAKPPLPALAELNLGEWERFCAQNRGSALVVFVIPWSGPCLQMLAGVQAALTDLPPMAAFKVTVQGAVTSPVLVRQFPTLLVLDGNGVRLQIVGNRPPATLKASLLGALAPG